MKLLQDYIKIGTIHFLTQAIAFIVLTKGMGLLFLQALSESPGWVMLSLWLVFNFLIIVLLVNLSEILLPSFSRMNLLVTAIKIFIVALVGGVVSYYLELVYYRYHFYYIGKEFDLHDSKNDLWRFMAYFPPVIVLGELIRRNTGLIRRMKFTIRKAVE